MKKLIIAIFIICIFNEILYSQFIKNFGIKGGLVIFSQHTYSALFGNNTGYGYNVGLFIECSIYKKLSSVTEIHFSDKGTGKGSAGVTSPYIFGYSDFVDISNRYQYLIFETHAKYKFTKKDNGFYTIIGIRFDMMLHNYYTGYDNYITFPNHHFEFGGIFGAGYTFPYHLFLELQYNPNFTNMIHYYGNGNDIYFKNSSVDLLLGINIK